MAFWNKYPYSDLHELNLDFILKKVQEGYTLPKATASVLGGIKVGNNLSITADGTLNATGGSSENNVFLVNFLLSGSTWVADKTYENIMSALASNKVVVGKVIADYDIQLALTTAKASSIQFNASYIDDDNKMKMTGFFISSSNVVTESTYTWSAN